MLKLLKYELKDNILPPAIACACFIISLILESDIFMFLSFIALIVLQILLITQTFGANLFGSKGALLLLLPLDLDSLLLAKIVSCLLLICASYGVIFFSLYFSGPMPPISVFFTHKTLLFGSYFFTFVLSCILQIFLTLALLHLFGITKMKLAIGLLFFLLLGAISGHINLEPWRYFFTYETADTFPSMQWNILRYIADSVIFYFLGRIVILRKLSL